MKSLSFVRGTRRANQPFYAKLDELNRRGSPHGIVVFASVRGYQVKIPGERKVRHLNRLDQVEELLTRRGY
jgi:hypothetical protein